MIYPKFDNLSLVMKPLYLLCVILIIGCNNKNGKNKNQRVIHPTEKNIHPSNISQKISDKSPDLINDDVIRALKDRINHYKKDFTIGKKEGKSYEMFGNIKDALIDRDNNQLYIIDAQNAGIEVFNLKGRFIHKVSREGKGPSELTRPAAIQLLNDKLFVQNGRTNIKIFDRKGTELSYDKTIVTKLPEAFCVSNDYLYTKNMTVTNPSSKNKHYDILQYRRTDYNTPINKFGKLYEANFWGAIVQMSVGGIVCSPKAKSVVQYFTYLNLIYGYDESGNLQWVTQIGDYNFIKLLEQNGKIGPDTSQFPMHYNLTKNVVSLDKNYFFVQVENRTLSRDENSSNGIKTYLISYKDGHGTLISKKLPWILSITSHRIAFKLQQKYPQIEVATY